MSETRGEFTAVEARRAGEGIGRDWASAPFDVEQLRIGMNPAGVEAMCRA
jgi:hypothetical protein